MFAIHGWILFAITFVAGFTFGMAAGFVWGERYFRKKYVDMRHG